MAKIQFPLQFERQYSNPIDIDMVFETTSSLNSYLTDDKRYAGMVVTCKEQEGKIFVLNNDKDEWLTFDSSLYEKTANKVTSFNTPTDIEYPSAKLVKDYVDSKVSSVYKIKGSVADYASLPTENLTVGDVYNLSDTGDNYVWDGTAWDKLGGTIDLSSYALKTDIKEDVVFQATSLESLTSGQKTAISTQIGDVLTSGEIDKEKFKNFILEITLTAALNKYYYQCVQYFMISGIATLYFASTQTTGIIKLYVDTLTPANSTLTNYKYYEGIQASASSFSGSTTNYLQDETNVDEAIKELDTQVKATNDTIQSVSDLSPYHYEGTFVGGDALQNDFDNLIVAFEDLREGTEFNETKLQGSYFVCSADSSFYFNTPYHWSAAEGTGKTSAITYTWAAPYDLNGLTEINMKAGDIISILEFSYNAVSNTISTLIKVEKNPAETFVLKNETITGATKPKITYDEKGLVTGGEDLTAEDIPTHQHTKSEITDFPTIPANKSYSKTITTANWDVNKKYAVTISGLVVSDTVLLSGADDIFTTNGLTATITANTLTFEVETLPTVSIEVNFTVIKTEGGTL